jgi:hypothetical protein
MTNLQYLRLDIIDSRTIQAVFENRDFRHLKALQLWRFRDLETAALDAMVVACPNLEQLVLRGSFESSCRSEDDNVKFIAESCPKLRTFVVDGSKEMRGDGWLDQIGTLFPRGQCFVCRLNDEPVNSELLRKAGIARSLYPKFAIFISHFGKSLISHQFNEKVVISALDVLSVLLAYPRPCDLTAQRVRFPNVLQQAARLRLSIDEAHPP